MYLVKLVSRNDPNKIKIAYSLSQLMHQWVKLPTKERNPDGWWVERVNPPMTHAHVQSFMVHAFSEYGRFCKTHKHKPRNAEEREAVATVAALKSVEGD